eukprot:8460569-Lingulodinium_polyedra.AAC.1
MAGGPQQEAPARAGELAGPEGAPRAARAGVGVQQVREKELPEQAIVQGSRLQEAVHANGGLPHHRSRNDEGRVAQDGDRG